MSEACFKPIHGGVLAAATGLAMIVTGCHVLPAPVPCKQPIAPECAAGAPCPPSTHTVPAAAIDPAVQQVGHTTVLPPATPPGPQAAGYLQAGPVFRGAELPALYPPTATEHAVELRRTIDELAGENESLRSTIDELEAQAARQEELVQRAEDELASARDELAAAREQIAAWTAEAKQLESELQNSRTNQNEAMQGVTDRLEAILRSHRQRSLESSADASDESAAAAVEEIRPLPPSR